MAEPALLPDDARTDAARIAYALLQFEEPLAHLIEAHPGMPAVGVDAYLFTPSWRTVPRSDIVPFLVALPSPALLSPTTTRGMIALTLLNELSGERRRWGEKTLSNATALFDNMANQLRLDGTSPILLEMPGEAAVYSCASVRLWTQQFGVQVGWTLSLLPRDPRARARLVARRCDGAWSHRLNDR